jgi:hypothetical protein
LRRRLLKTKGDRGLFLTTDPAIGSWTSWEPLTPAPDHVDPAARLLGESAPKVAAIGGLYGDRSASRDDERRRAADAVLKSFGVR